MREYIILGLIQGLLEWIPVSSEGFLVLAGSGFGFDNLIQLALWLHLGTLFSAAFYFRKDLFRIASGKDMELRHFLINSTAATAITGIPLYSMLNSSAFNGVWILAITGIGLIFTGWILGKKKEHAGISKLTKKHALRIGLLQGLAIIPGVSRSGLTVFGLAAQNYDQETALKVSFLMSIPVVLAGNVFLQVSGFGFQQEYLIALVVAFLIGLGTIHTLLKFSQKISFRWFCWFFGALALIGFGIAVI